MNLSQCIAIVVIAVGIVAWLAACRWLDDQGKAWPAGSGRTF